MRMRAVVTKGGKFVVEVLSEEFKGDVAEFSQALADEISFATGGEVGLVDVRFEFTDVVGTFVSEFKAVVHGRGDVEFLHR